MQKSYGFIPVGIALISFLSIQILVFNLGLNFRDEGFLNSNAIRILNGEIPYKDFFLTTTPGAYYLQSLVFKVFGIHIILGRYLYMFCVMVLLIITNSLLGNMNKILKTSALLLIALTFTGVGAFAFYNIEGLVLLLLAILIYIKGQNSKINIFFIGVLLGILYFFKQSYGIFAFSAFICLFFLNSLNSSIKQSLFLLSGVTVAIAPFLGYLVLNKAFTHFIYFTFIFAQEVKDHRAPFVLTSLLFIPVFLLALHTIKRVTRKRAFIILGFFIFGFFLVYVSISPDRLQRISIYIKDPLIYYYGFSLVFPLLLISSFKKMKNKTIIPYSVFTLSLFLAGASSGRDFTTITVLFPLIILLCVELASVTHKRVFVLIIILYGSFPLIFFGIFLKNLTTQIAYTQLPLPQFEGIFLPKENVDDIVSVVKFIKNSTTEDETLLCFPYCPIMNIITQRKSGSYFSFFYPETIRVIDQKQVIDSLKKNGTKIIILQEPGKIEKEAYYENKRLSLLTDYFRSNFNPVFSSNNFTVYRK